jgi:hypothetical protein
MSIETVYIVCIETLIFILLEGGLLSVIIENWQNDAVGFVIFYISSAVSFVVVAVCCSLICHGYVYKPVILIARAALIFDVVLFFSFLLTANEWFEDDKEDHVMPHAMPVLLFKSSTSVSSFLTVSYLVIAASISAIVVILNFCVYQQLLGTFLSLRTESRYKVYTYINRVLQLIDDEDLGAQPIPESSIEQDHAHTKIRHRLQRILKLATDVRDEQQFDSVYLESWRQLLQVMVRALLIVSCVLYDMKACLEIDEAFLELAPSLGLIVSFAFFDCIVLIHKAQQKTIWRSVLFFALLLPSFAYLALTIVAATAYVSDASSIFLSDTRKTFLNNVLFVTAIIDAFLCVYDVVRDFVNEEFVHHNLRGGAVHVPTHHLSVHAHTHHLTAHVPTHHLAAHAPRHGPGAARYYANKSAEAPRHGPGTARYYANKSAEAPLHTAETADMHGDDNTTTDESSADSQGRGTVLEFVTNGPTDLKVDPVVKKNK